MKQYKDKSLSSAASDLNHQAYKEGCQYYEEGNYNKAKNAFTESLEYWQQDSHAWWALGNCYDQLDNPIKAEESFRKALKYAAPKKQPDILFNLANSLFDQAKFDEAIECYGKVSSQSSIYQTAQRNMELAKNAQSDKNP